MKYVGYVAVVVGIFLLGKCFGPSVSTCQTKKPVTTSAHHALRTPVQQRPARKDRVREIPVAYTKIFVSSALAQEPSSENTPQPQVVETQTDANYQTGPEVCNVPPDEEQTQPQVKKRSTKWNVGVFLDRGHIGADISVGNDRHRGGYNSRRGDYRYEDRYDDRYGGNSRGSNCSNSYRNGGWTQGGNRIPPSAPPISGRW